MSIRVSGSFLKAHGSEGGHRVAPVLEALKQWFSAPDEFEINDVKILRQNFLGKFTILYSVFSSSYSTACFCGMTVDYAHVSRQEK